MKQKHTFPLHNALEQSLILLDSIKVSIKMNYRTFYEFCKYFKCVKHSKYLK